MYILNRLINHTTKKSLAVFTILIIQTWQNKRCSTESKEISHVNNSFANRVVQTTPLPLNDLFLP